MMKKIIFVPTVVLLFVLIYVSCGSFVGGGYDTGGGLEESRKSVVVGSDGVEEVVREEVRPNVSSKRRVRRLDLPPITSNLIEHGQAGRWRVRPMRPRYITVHSTQNFSRGAGAAMHARALRNGALKSRHNSLGFLTWHYTVDDHSIHQHLPDHEQGQHADYEGMGNRYSIGIEICENRDGDLERAKDHAAKLVAQLMKKHRIGIEGVKAHYHWERIRYDDGKNLGHKNCPHFLMTNGKPGAKWEAYKAKIERYYRQLR